MNWPKLGLYDAANDAFGAPWLVSNGAGGYVVNASPAGLAAIEQLAAWDVIAFGVPPFVSSIGVCGALAVQLKALNPSLKILVKPSLLQVYFNPASSPDPANDIRGKIKAAIRALPGDNGVLWSATYAPANGYAGGPDFFNADYSAGRPQQEHFSNWALNLANFEAVDALVEVFKRELMDPAVLAGLYLDFAGLTIKYASGHGGASHPFEVLPKATVEAYNLNPPLWSANGWNYDTIDAARAGGFTQNDAGAAAFDAQYKLGHRRLMAGLRSAGGPDFLLGINSGGSVDPAEDGDINGVMVENVFQLGGAGGGDDAFTRWKKNMLGTGQQSTPPIQRGMFPNDALTRPPSLNWLNALPRVDDGGANGGDYDSRLAANAAYRRFVMGTAALGGLYASMTTNQTPSGDTAWAKDWAEDCVDISTGESRPRTDLEHHGWLGNPIAPYYLTQGCYRREFRNGTVIVNPTTTSKTVALGLTYRRIKSSVPGDTVNDGSAVTFVAVPPQDAAFLLKPTPGATVGAPRNRTPGAPPFWLL